MTGFDLNHWRQLLAKTNDEALWLKTYGDAVRQFAQWVPQGLDRGFAIDSLENLAQAYCPRPHMEVASHLLADGFADVADDVITDALLEPHKANGHGKPKLPILSKAEFIKGFSPPDYLIEGILQRRFIYSLTGQTGHAKTAVALLLATLVASSTPNTTLAGKPVDHGRVVYFVGENPDDVRMRVIGYDYKRTDDAAGDRLFFIPGIFNIAEMTASLDDDLRRHGPASLIVVDTSAAYFLGNEEVNNVQMGAYARLLRTLTKLPGEPTVLVLCHPIKHVIEPSQLLPRGGGAYLAEMDGNLTLWRIGEDMVELHHTGKFRGPDFPAMTFKLEPIKDCPQLLDAKGKQITTVRAVVISQAEEDAQAARELGEEDLLLAAMLEDAKRSYADLATAAKILYPDGRPNKKKAQRLMERLEKGRPKLTVRNRHGWALTEQGKEQGREVALRLEREHVARQEAARQEALRF
jgi:hypothetical protein